MEEITRKSSKEKGGRRPDGRSMSGRGGEKTGVSRRSTGRRPEDGKDTGHGVEGRKSGRSRNAGRRPENGEEASRTKERVADGKSIRQRDDRKRQKSVREEEMSGSSAGSGRRRGRRKKKQKNLMTNIVLAVAFAVFCISAFQLIKICKGYYDGRSEYDKIRDLALENKKGGNDDGPRFQVDFDELLALNPDTIAWIRFDPEPAAINYPVVQGKDNEEYLHKTFSANENTLGTIFLNVDNSAGFRDENSILYGHYMNDGSMFRHLEDYKDKAFWEANPYFYIYTPDGEELVYHIYSTGEVLDTSDTYLTDFPTNDDYQKFLNMTKEVAMYDTGVEVTTADTIVTLSTCTSANNDHRFVVRGVKVREGNE